MERVELSQLPALPEVLTRLIQELHNENLNLTDLSALILQDSALAMKVLAVANSSFYNRRNPVDSVQQSVNLLGLKMVKMIAVSAAMHQFLQDFAGMTPAGFARFWQHALMTAFLSKSMAQSIAYPNPEEAYLAGLLHDIGQLALLATSGRAYSDLLQKYADEDTLVEQEQLEFGVTHGEVGAQLAEHWHLEPLLADAIRHHHDSVAKILSATELVKLVNAANALGRMDMESNHPALVVARNLFGIPVEKARRLHADAAAQIDIVAMVNAVDTGSEGTAAAAQTTASTGQRKLQAEVHATTMLSLLQESMASATDEEALLGDLLQAAQMLFEPRQAMLFAWDAEANLVCGHPLGEQNASLARMRLPLEAGRSLIADALLQNAMTHSFDTAAADSPRSMTDEQIMRMAAADGMYCVPLRNQKFVYGVLVLAYSAAVQQRADSQLRFLSAFARQAADAIFALRQRLQSATLDSALQEKNYQLRARQIVHEANNPLAILKNYLSMLDYKLADSQPVAKELQVLNEEIDRVADIIRKFASPAQAQTATAGRVDVNRILQDLVAVCDTALFAPAKIRAELHLDDQLPAVAADADRLKQVFVNLFKNAAEAMANGGTLSVTSALAVGQQQAQSVVVSVADSGPGMPKEVLAQLFTPVQTSKGAGNSGLGLSICASLLNEMGGAINCRSVPGMGTVFEVTLPCPPKSADGPGSS